MKRVFTWAVSLLTVFCVALLVAGVAIYRFHFESRFTNFMKSVVPYPAMLINGEFISVQDFEKERNFASDFVNFQQQRLTGQTLSADDETQFLESLPEYIQNRILWKQMAASQGIVVTQEDIEALLQSALLDLGGQANLDTFLNQHGYTVDLFKAKLVEPSVYREKLTAALSAGVEADKDTDPSTLEQQKQQAFTTAYQEFRQKSYIRSFYSG